MSLARDGANLFVLEGILISLILLGAAYVVRGLHVSSLDNERQASEFERLAADTLVILAGMDDGNGTSLLDRYMMEALHCAHDAVPSPVDCDGSRSKNLTVKVDHYLPPGGGYALTLGNGVAARDVWRSPLPHGESVVSSLVFLPSWNLTFAASELSCYEAGMDVNVSLVPIDRGALSWARASNVTIAGTEIVGERAFTPGWWNVSLPAATRPASGTLVVNASANATLPGAASYGSCALGGAGPALRTALRSATFGPTQSAVSIGGSVTLSADIASILAVPGATVTSVEATVYAPLAPRGHDPDSWIEVARVPLAGGATRSASWAPAASEVFGTHPVVLRVGIDVNGGSVELRRVALVDVALPDGALPRPPVYRVALQTWLADWG